MKIFIDCDDTLILYKDRTQERHGFGLINGEEWDFNEKLYKALIAHYSRVFLNAPCQWIIWSGGGQTYAKSVISAIMTEVSPAIERHVNIIIGKDNMDHAEIQPEKGDIVIDDDLKFQEFCRKVGATFILPEDFINIMSFGV